MHRIKQSKTQNDNPLFRVLTMIVITSVVICLFSIPAFAENTYRITDGDWVLIVTSDSTDPLVVLDEAGLELGKDDTYTTQESEKYSEIYVQRVQMITINNGGQLIKIGSYGETVGALLERLSITMDEDDRLSVELTDEVYDGMEIVIDRVNYVTETYAKTIAFETEYVYYDEMPEGTEVVVTAGCDGEMLVTDEVTYTNGEEVARETVETETTVKAVNEVIAVGTGSTEETSGKLFIGDGIIVTAEGDVYTYTNTMQVKATAYTHTDAGCNKTTATGTTVRWGTVAVDPSVIPYGTRMFIVSNDGKYVYGVSTAEDCGGAIKSNRVDLYMPTTSQCYAFGVRNCTIYFLGT